MSTDKPAPAPREDCMKPMWLRLKPQFKGENFSGYDQVSGSHFFDTAGVEYEFVERSAFDAVVRERDAHIGNNKNWALLQPENEQLRNLIKAKDLALAAMGAQVARLGGECDEWKATAKLRAFDPSTEIERLEKELQESQDHLADSQCDREKLQSELAEAKGAVELPMKALVELKSTISKLHAENTDLLQKFNDAWDSYQNALGKLSDARSELEQQRQWIIDRCSERDQAQARCKRLEGLLHDVLDYGETFKLRDKIKAALGETSCEPKSSGNPDSAPP